ncbi:MAG: glycosyltransferase family 4 protein [Microbacterium gubbeenense]
MRVAYVCTDPGIPVDGSKGASVHVQQIVRAFQRRGDDVTVYATRSGSAEMGGAPIVTVPVGRGDAADRERAVARAAVQIAERIADDGCDLVYERLSLFSDVSARVAAPAVVEVNAPLIEEQRTHRTLVDETGATAAVRRVLSRAATVACVSEPVAEWALAHGSADASTIVAPNGVDTRAFAPAELRDGILEVVFIGSLKSWHGVDIAIAAIADLEGVRLTIIGDGPERERLEGVADAIGADVRWLGAIPHEAVPAELNAMHVGVAPYPATADAYFSPLKAFEYLAAGLAVVASETGQIPSLIAHDDTGILVPAGGVDALRGALTTLRDDRGLARRLGSAGRARAVSQHDWDRTLDRILPGGFR